MLACVERLVVLRVVEVTMSRAWMLILVAVPVAGPVDEFSTSTLAGHEAST